MQSAKYRLKNNREQMILFFQQMNCKNKKKGEEGPTYKRELRVINRMQCVCLV